MVMDGAVVMVENIVRHMNHRQESARPRSVSETIRDACHEGQRPVFYAIAIIITAYLPIFTLQRIEGRLFRPMAWTVAFRSLGAMTFSILIAPVLARAFFARELEMRETQSWSF
jgi:cobalt-zinc-cadmium resistance protein CzcA